MAALLSRAEGDDEGEARRVEERAELVASDVELPFFKIVETQLDEVCELSGALD
jgi:hypothetical protein